MKNLILTFMFVASTILAQNEIYKSNDYSIYGDKVIQGKFFAEAISRNEIRSNYKSDFKVRTKSLITFKFSLNGLDNERKPGQDHTINIYSENGKIVSPVYKFGYDDPLTYEKDLIPEFIEKETETIFRVDLNHVLKSFNEKGFYETFDGNKISKDEFEGVYIAGAMEPLNWDFPNLNKSDNFKLNDNDGDGIYEIKIKFSPEKYPGNFEGEFRIWKLQKDISNFPSLKTDNILIDALYNLSLEEMLLDIRDDGAFMAGAMWFGVWTRDISYSILLSLAIVNPDASKVSLMAKVKNGKIIQDTGTGGAWPVSSDRMTWALAAYEIYLVTGDKDWLKQSFHIIKNSIEADLFTVRDLQTKLFKGESSFLDWREQTYPRWMDPKDIYQSLNLGTNAVHFRTYQILSEMAELLGEDNSGYLQIASQIKDAMNKYFWMNDKNYYGQFLYGRNLFSLSPRFEALGEALSILFEISNEENSKKIIENSPVGKFGTPSIYPQIPNIPPYHNNSMWPFVQAFWNLAAVKSENPEAVNFGISSIIRPAALFLSNKENLVASTGDYLGTEINSDRQLWSVAGNLATTYRILFGMKFENSFIRFSPFIPEGYKGVKELNNFKYRNSVLNIKINGYGDKIVSFKIDGVENEDHKFPADFTDEHLIEITMNNSFKYKKEFKIVKNYFSPETPELKLEDSKLFWNSVPGAVKYDLYANGKKFESISDTFKIINAQNEFIEYQVLSIDNKGVESFLSEPVISVNKDFVRIIEAEISEKSENEISGFSGNGYISLIEDKNQILNYEIDIDKSGDYIIDFKYSNGNGPINTDNKCAIRTLIINSEIEAPLIMPQRGDGNWNDWGFSNSIAAELKKGKNIFQIIFTDKNHNMNFDENNAKLDFIRLIFAD